jgi:hypothetical protein
MEMKGALGFLVGVVVVYGPAFTSNAQPRKITEEEKAYYGATKSGGYMCEPDAISAGIRAAKNEPHP